MLEMLAHFLYRHSTLALKVIFALQNNSSQDWAEYVIVTCELSNLTHCVPHGFAFFIKFKNIQVCMFIPDVYRVLIFSFHAQPWLLVAGVCHTDK